MIENLLVCVYLPQTSFGCRVTGHCEPGAVLWDRPTSALEDHVKSGVSAMFDALPFDRVSTLTIALSVTVVTILLLLAQAVVLDKSHLSTIGYQHAGNQDVFPQHGKPSHQTTGGAKHRHKGKASETNTTSQLGSLSSLDSRTADADLRTMQLIFQYELGHTSQSTVLVILTKVQLICVAVIFFLCCFRLFMHWNFLAMSVALFANVLSAFAVSCLTDTTEFEIIADEIRGEMELNPTQRAEK